MNQVTDKIWSENAEKFMNVVHSSQKNVLHPLLAELINKQSPGNLLDFGCGDGRILNLLDEKTIIDVYDKNKEMLQLAKHRAGRRINNYYESILLTPANHYDIILLSMVLVCIDNESEYLNVLSKIKCLKKATGKVYIAVSHPCFRDRRFSNFSTSYCEAQPFNYLNNGEPFNVLIEDEMPPSVAFTDYHWSFSFTINKIIEAGMSIEQVIETPDDLRQKSANPLHSAFLIIIAK